MVMADTRGTLRYAFRRSGLALRGETTCLRSIVDAKDKISSEEHLEERREITEHRIGVEG